MRISDWSSDVCSSDLILFVPTGSSTGNYTISWSTVSGATRYRLDEKVETGSWSQILEGSATDLEFYARAPGSYSYRVRACGTTDANTCRSFSPTKSIEIAAPVPPNRPDERRVGEEYVR